MSKTWLLICVLVSGIAVGGGGTYYMVAPKKPVNPLLTANATDFYTFVPNYYEPCSQIMFEGKDPKGLYDLCARQTITNVRLLTGVDLTHDDLRDPRVKARWLAISSGAR
jgi:hypothetical protein